MVSLRRAAGAQRDDWAFCWGLHLMFSTNRILGSAVVVALATLWSGSALAQRQSCFPDAVNGTVPAACTQVGLTIPFDILPPGARSLGLGGAFAAVADDATAAEANPAGQVILTKPELSIHGRHASYDVPFGNANILEPSAVTGASAPPFAEYEDSNSKVSFASFVYPFERFVLSGYYHNAGALSASTVSAAFDSTFIDAYAEATALDVEQESAGLSGAFRIGDKISIGASIKYARLDLDYASASALSDFRDAENGSLADALLIDDFQSLTTLASGEDSDITYNVGILVNPNGEFSVGLVYKEGGEYSFDSQLRYDSTYNCNGVAGCDPDLGFNASIPFARGNTTIELPDVISLGFAVRPSDTWLLSLQFDHVDYGDLPQPRATSLIFGVPANAQTVDATITTHVGVEKTFLFDQPVLGMGLLSVRVGAFNDRDHDGFADLKTNENHYTFGLGTVFFEKLQVDVASEWSDKIDNIVLSTVYRF
jgi:long-chain fatty acid transport protein